MDTDKGSKKRASDDLNDIEALRKTPAFVTYWSRRILIPLDSAREALLHGKLKGQDLEEARMRYEIWKEVSEMVIGDEASCRRILEESIDE